MSGIVYSIVPKERSLEVAHLLLNSFYKEEPLCAALCMPLNQVARWLPAYTAKAVEHNVSVMVVDPSKIGEGGSLGKIIGVSLNIIKGGDMAPLKHMAEYTDPITEPIASIFTKYMAHIHKEIETPANEDRILECLLLNVSSDYRGHRIGNELANKTVEIGRTLGINCFQVDTTSDFSTQAFQSVGYEVIRTEKFQDFVYEGRQVFQDRDTGCHQNGRVLCKIVKVANVAA